MKKKKERRRKGELRKRKDKEIEAIRVNLENQLQIVDKKKKELDKFKKQELPDHENKVEQAKADEDQAKQELISQIRESDKTSEAAENNQKKISLSSKL